ncbi:MAG: hypothetical protein ACODAU_00770 [Myxococcota bacterium]
MLDEATLARHLERLGWEMEPHGERTWRSVQDTDEGEIVVYLRCTDNWLMASVVPFLSTEGDISFELSRWLLRMTRDMFQAKFAYDEDGDVVLAVELPTESLDFGEVRSTLESLRRYAIMHRATLRQAAAQSAE